MHIPEHKLKDLLLNSGIIKEKAFAAATSEAGRLAMPLAEVLVSRGEITEDYLIELLESNYHIPIIDLRKRPALSKEIIGLVPESYAKAKNVVIFEKDEKKNTLKLAMADPLDYETIEFLRAKLKMEIEVYLTARSSLKFGLKQYGKEIKKEFDEIISENVKKVMGEVGGEIDMSKLADALPIVTILDSIIEHAVALNASDIHFEPLPNELLIRYRVDGILDEILTLQKVIEPILVARVKILANLQIDEHQTPQDGRFRSEMAEGGFIDIRVNIMPVMNGEKIEMRLLKSAARPLTLEELGLSAKGIQQVQEEIKKPHGMILVTGPTGHGKTTTLYAILHILNTPAVNINTIEDPIEYEIPRANQTQVNQKAGITFANGLRALVRQNPDIVMIGEIRDDETVEIGIHAALTGHLVLSSLHTNDAPSAIPRLLDMKAPAFLLASTVIMVIAQRLVRKNCTRCVYSFPIPKEIENLVRQQLKLIGETKIEDKIPRTLFKGKGCDLCNHTGYAGQTGIFEILEITDGIRELILRSKPANEIKKQGIKEDMVTMFEDGLQKVERGVTTIEEILRVVNE